MRKFLAALMLFSLAGCTSAGYEAQQVAAAGLPAGARFDFEGNTVRYADADITAEASYLSPSQADLYFSLFKGGKYKNPIPHDFFVFQVNIENRGKKNIVFNPGMAYLLPKDGRPSPPTGYTDFSADLQLAGAEETDEISEAFKAAVLDTAITLRPGGRAQGLLVFSLDNKVQESAVLVFNDIYIGSASRTVPFQFRGVLAGRQP